MVTIKKVLEKHYIVKFGDNEIGYIYFDLYIDLNEDGFYESFFFNEYIECKTINEVKKEVKKFIINHN